jgi:hypothetical protein
MKPSSQPSAYKKKSPRLKSPRMKSLFFPNKKSPRMKSPRKVDRGSIWHAAHKGLVYY